MRHPGAPRILALAAIVTAAAVPARAQLRAGPEFRVNTYTPGDQVLHSISSRKSEVVVVWESYGEDGDNFGVFGQVYRDDGAPLGLPFRVNAVTTGPQGAPVVAHDGNEFVVAWSASQDGSGSGVVARRFRKDGTPIGGDFQVNAYTTGYQFVTSIAKGRRNGSAAGFVVVWSDDTQDYGSVVARRFDERGVPQGGDFRVNVYGDYQQFGGRVAMAEDGRFVVVWASYMQDGDSLGVFGRRFDAAGSPVGGEFRVNTVTTSYQYAGGVAMASDGTFVVVWQENDGSYLGVRARRFDAGGQPQGSELQVNTYTTYNQEEPRVAVNERGDFTVVWMSNGPKPGNSLGVFGQHFDKLGARLGAEFQANTYTTDNQRDPEVAVDAVGNFTVTWASQYQDGSDHGIYGQRFGGILLTAMAVGATASPTSDGNGVLEPGETVTIETFWRNVNGAAQGPLSGQVISFTGPGDAPATVYSMPDPNAGFGVIPNGATVGCSVTQNCYLGGVTGVRPALDWDAVMDERVASLIPRQHRRWRVHVGDSFGDVPRTSPFYRFIETLLHFSITGGCTGGYCPGNPTTREQMSVFVLVAKEGAGYVPPACTTPVFTDVPAGSPFCRFIEELARRGVVAGCAPGLFCPTSPVTREQMAVFVLRTLDPALDPPACVPPNLFADVPETSPFCRWVEELARRGVVSGCGDDNYCPTSPVTREQMGVFLTVTFGLRLYGA